MSSPRDQPVETAPPPSLSFTTLPTELHIEIASFLPQSALSALSVTCHHFHRLLTRPLYHTPVLPAFYDHLLLFVRTLNTNPHRIGRHLHHLHFHHSDPWDARAALRVVKNPGIMQSIKTTVRRRFLVTLETLELVLPGELQLGGWWEKEWRKVRERELEEEQEGKRPQGAVKVAIGNVTRDEGVVRFVVGPSDGMGWVGSEGRRGEYFRQE
ncbi:hypothetical protein EX30DRAFT_394999 [Ascodesmis nigricans]|uniref:F-box domain-containing protein n=1 Tax=Ascodesmis nigricans TaxID=341454 RepID=A0A4S2MZQ0_9PEZI|nr:hypothetical protein EX30DRAFT_394999 [Ascodesmis nigricans]